MKITIKNNLKRLGTITLAAVLGTSVLAGCGSKSGSAQAGYDKKNTIRVAVMTGQPDQYQIFIGQQQGIFEKYGLNIETTEYAYGINTIDAVVNGTADTGEMADFAAVNRIGNSDGKTDLVIFSESAVDEPKTGGLYVAPEYADDPGELVNSKGIVTSVGTVSEYYAWQALDYLEIDPEKIKYVNTDSEQTTLALINKGDAAAVVGYGAQQQYYEDAGWKLVASAQDIGINTGSYLLTTKNFNEANEKNLADYLKALQESTDYINEHLDETAAAVEKKFGVKAENFKADWQAKTLRVGFTEEGAAHLEEIADWAYTHDKYDKEFNVRNYIDVTAAKQYDPASVTISGK